MSPFVLVSVTVGALLQLASGHVNLRYPPPILKNDFLDNARTRDICGLEASTDESELWKLPDASSPVTTLVAGQSVDVRWDLHYAHQGGFMLELYDANMTLVHRWNTSNAGAPVWGDESCSVDGTLQQVNVTLPSQPCNGCTLRFLREAKEWGANYLFKSCARVNLVAANNPSANGCQGCSGRGTCGATGECACVGNFYGPHCELENECSADADCGPRGKCVDVDEQSGPARQCFCEAGWFGDVRRAESGLEYRFCDRPSGLSITGAADFREGLEREEGSPGGEYEAAWGIRDSQIEVAMRSATTSWVAIGLRSAGSTDAAASVNSVPTKSEPAAEAEAGSVPAKSEPAAEAEAESAPAASESRRRRSRMMLQAPPPEPEASPAAAEGSASKPAAAEGAAKAEPAAEGEAVSSAEGAPAEGESAASEGGAAEGEGAAVQTCPVVAVNQVVSPQMLAGVPVSAQEAAALRAASAAPAAEGEGASSEGASSEGASSEGASSEGASSEGAAASAEGAAAGAEAPAGRRRGLLGMPAVESEAASMERAVRTAARRLAETYAEGESVHSEDSKIAAATTGASSEGAAAPETKASSESEGAPSSEGAASESEGAPAAGAASLELSYIAGGPCEGQAVTPQSAFAMINQDVVLGVAREIDGVQYFRVVDMFTPSRAKPLPDHEFCKGTGAARVCGTDDITDAIGVEVDGETFVRFTRALVTADPSFTDTCLSEDQRTTLVYAYGQLTAGASHTPQSALEVIPAEARANPDFYPEDVLKFHGGGIGTSFPGRGILGTMNMFVDESALTAGGCTPSSEPAFDCMTERLGGALILHYNAFQPGDTEATMGIEMPTATGWASIAFPDPASPTQMVGSTAVIVTDDAAANGLGVFALNGKAVGAVNELATGRRLSQAPFELTNASVERAGRTLAVFTRSFDENFQATADAQPLLTAVGSGNGLAYHTAREDFQLSLSVDAAAGAGNTGSDLTDDYRLHGWLMTFAWGVFAPIGVLLAAGTKSYGKVKRLGAIWFLGHRVAMVVVLVLSTIGFAIAVDKFNLQSEDDFYKHKVIGYIVVIIGWLQPLNALIRPHAPGQDEKRSPLRFVWELLHKMSGRAALLLGVINIYYGIELGDERAIYDDSNGEEKFTIIFSVWLAVYAVTGFFLVGLDWLRRRRQGEAGKADQRSNSAASASSHSHSVQKPLDDAAATATTV